MDKNEYKALDAEDNGEWQHPGIKVAAEDTAPVAKSPRKVLKIERGFYVQLGLLAIMVIVLLIVNYFVMRKSSQVSNISDNHTNMLIVDVVLGFHLVRAAYRLANNRL